MANKILIKIKLEEDIAINALNNAYNQIISSNSIDEDINIYNNTFLMIQNAINNLKYLSFDAPANLKVSEANVIEIHRYVNILINNIIYYFRNLICYFKYIQILDNGCVIQKNENDQIEIENDQNEIEIEDETLLKCPIEIENGFIQDFYYERFN